MSKFRKQRFGRSSADLASLQREESDQSLHRIPSLRGALRQNVCHASVRSSSTSLRVLSMLTTSAAMQRRRHDQARAGLDASGHPRPAQRHPRTCSKLRSLCVIKASVLGPPLWHETLTLLFLQGSPRKATPTSCADAMYPQTGTSVSYSRRRARSLRTISYGRGLWVRSR